MVLQNMSKNSGLQVVPDVDNIRDENQVQDAQAVTDQDKSGDCCTDTISTANIPVRFTCIYQIKK